MTARLTRLARAFAADAVDTAVGLAAAVVISTLRVAVHIVEDAS